tara:strand:- start:3737 stop:3928 length:192 start_codon:yes stop_codon:yes gene_type:complete
MINIMNEEPKKQYLVDEPRELISVVGKCEVMIHDLIPARGGGSGLAQKPPHSPVRAVEGNADA